jgi:hypothetical protein
VPWKNPYENELLTILCSYLGRGTVEYDIAKAGGKLMERENGVIERSVDADEYVAAVLESLRK